MAIEFSLSEAKGVFEVMMSLVTYAWAMIGIGTIFRMVGKLFVDLKIIKGSKI